MNCMDIPKKVYSRGRTMVGQTTGSVRSCAMEGCRGRRIGVRWPNGKVTFPCTRGMDFSPKGVTAEII